MDQQEFEKYLREMFLFQGKMNTMANSIELMLDFIFEKVGINSPKMLGGKIQKFNKSWVIAKHGMIVGGTENPTIHKDGNFYIFDREKQDEIDQEFSQIISALTEISKQI